MRTLLFPSREDAFGRELLADGDCRRMVSSAINLGLPIREVIHPSRAGGLTPE